MYIGKFFEGGKLPIPFYWRPRLFRISYGGRWRFFGNRFWWCSCAIQWLGWELNFRWRPSLKRDRYKNKYKED